MVFNIPLTYSSKYDLFVNNTEAIHLAIYIHMMKPMETLVEYLLSLGRHYSIISDKFFLPFLSDSRIDEARALSNDTEKLVNRGTFLVGN